MVPFYLELKGAVESLILGPGLFWLLFAVMACTRKSRGLKKREFAQKIGFWGVFLIVLLTAPPFLEIITYPLYRLVPVREAKGAEVIVVLGGGG